MRSKWIGQAACRNLSQETINRVLLNTNPYKKDIDEAKTICNACPVQKSCLVDAIKTEEGLEGRSGTFIWGGMNLRQRMHFYKNKLLAGTWEEYVEEARKEEINAD